MALSGNDPIDRKEFLIDRIEETSSASSTLEWAAVPGAFYLVESCTNLVEGTWTNLVAEINATGTNVALDIETSKNTTFYRIKETF